jgi:uncharacterized membrane protein YozB (DUF420 family)
VDIVTLIATIGLIFQVAILFLIFVGYTLMTKTRFRYHGIIMLIAVALHIIMILGLMVPSFVLAIIPLITENSTNVGVMLAPIHIIPGTIAAVLGVWIVSSWRLREPLQYCAPKKRIMVVTLILWVTALVIGVLVYLGLYTNLFS